MNKKILSVVLSFVMVVGMAFSGVASAESGIKFIAADDHHDGYPTVEAVKYMAKYIEEKTDGRLTIEMHPGAELGSEKETVELTQMGVIDINRVSIAPVTNVVPVLNVLALPYIFKNDDHMHAVLDGKIGQEILEHPSLKEAGLIGLAYFDAGSRSFYNTKRPIYKPSDLDGLKIRVQKSNIMIDTMKALGASPTPMAFEEVYTALQTGVIDGAENNWPSLYTTRHYEAVKYYSLDGHTRLPEILLMSKSTWDRLSPEDKKIVKDAAIAATVRERELWKEMVEESKKAVLEAGVEVNEVDVDAFIEAVQPVYDKYASDPESRELIEKIRKLGEQF